MNKIEKFHLSLCEEILGVKNNTSSSKLLGDLGRFLLRITIETQLFKYLQKLSFVKQDCYLRKAFNDEQGCYLRKAFNEELANKGSGWVTKRRHLLDSYGMYNSILNIFKVLNGEIETLLYTYKNEKNNFFHKKKNSLKMKDV